jgi:DNA-binding IclR family transcriptional regulator
MKVRQSEESQAGAAVPEALPGENRVALRVVDILDLFFRAREGLTLTDVATELGVPKSSAHGILQTLRRCGYLAWDPRTKAYSIGLRLYALAQAAPVLRTIQRVARRHVERLARELEETTILCGLDGDGGAVTGIVCVDQVESPSPVRYSVEVGAHWPLHCTTVGKLYLATLPDSEVIELLSRTGVERFTPQTPSTIDEVLEDIEEIRKNGYAVNRSELVEGVTGYGAPIHVGGDVLVAGLAVLGPAERVRGKGEAVVEELLGAAQALSAALDAVA